MFSAKESIRTLLIMMILIFVFIPISNADSDTLYMTDQLACNNLCITLNDPWGNPFPEGECNVISEPVTSFCVGYTNAQPQGDAGTCSGPLVNCYCCYNANTCDGACKAEGHEGGGCSINTASYTCNQDGLPLNNNINCYYNRVDWDNTYNDGNNVFCPLFVNCWCYDVDMCDACDEPPDGANNDGACTASGCDPRIIPDASCTAGNCGNPYVSCAYGKRDSGGTGQGACIVGSTGGWEGLTCSSWTDESPCGCDTACGEGYCDLSGCSPATAVRTNACPSNVALLGESASCHIRLPCAGGTSVITGESGVEGGACWNSASQYSGIYSASDSSCVLCAGWTKAGTILADASGIKVDCQGNAETISPSRCEQACEGGLPIDPLCDDHVVGEGCDPEDPEKKCTILCECDGDDGDTCDPDENYADGSNDDCTAADSSEPYCCSDNGCHECCGDDHCLYDEDEGSLTYKVKGKCDCPDNPGACGRYTGPPDLYKCVFEPCLLNSECDSGFCCDYEGPFNTFGTGPDWLSKECLGVTTIADDIWICTNN